MRVVVAESPEGLKSHVGAWEALSAEATEPNVFLEPWFLQPALVCFGAGQRLRFVLVYENDGGVGDVLQGFFPLETVDSYRGVPLRHFRVWIHEYCFLATPLLRRGSELACLGAFFDWLKDQDACFMSWELVNGDGPFFRALMETVGGRHLESFLHAAASRALLRPKGDVESYLDQALSKRSRKDLRRRERRLAELGSVEFASLEGTDQLDAWIEEFLQVEASGWKGRNGTAMQCTPGVRRFFQDAAREAGRRGRLGMHALRVAGQPVAMQCDFLADDGAFAFKIAHDEAHAACAPGVLLEIENIRRCHAKSQPSWTDSCAKPSNELSNRLWLDRRTLVDFVAASERKRSQFVVSLLPLLRWTFRLVPKGHKQSSALLPPFVETCSPLLEPAVAEPALALAKLMP